MGPCATSTYRPFSQRTHDTLSAVAYCPASQSSQYTRPPGETFPGGHGRQSKAVKGQSNRINRIPMATFARRLNGSPISRPPDLGLSVGRGGPAKGAPSDMVAKAVEGLALAQAELDTAVRAQASTGSLPPGTLGIDELRSNVARAKLVLEISEEEAAPLPKRSSAAASARASSPKQQQRLPQKRSASASASTLRQRKAADDRLSSDGATADAPRSRGMAAAASRDKGVASRPRSAAASSSGVSSVVSSGSGGGGGAASRSRDRFKSLGAAASGSSLAPAAGGGKGFDGGTMGHAEYRRALERKAAVEAANARREERLALAASKREQVRRKATRSPCGSGAAGLPCPACSNMCWPRLFFNWRACAPPFAAIVHCPARLPQVCGEALGRAGPRTDVRGRQPQGPAGARRRRRGPPPIAQGDSGGMVLVLVLVLLVVVVVVVVVRSAAQRSAAQ